MISHKKKISKMKIVYIFVCIMAFTLCFGVFAIKSAVIKSALADESSINNNVSSDTLQYNNNKKPWLVNENLPELKFDGKVYESKENKSYRDIPSSWNSYEKGLVPDSVRDQSFYGSCWSFGTTGALESSLITKGLTPKGRHEDLSERQLIYYMFNDKNVPDPLNLIGNSYNQYIDLSDHTKEPCLTYLDSLGNSFSSALKWMNWCGPIAEEKSPYEELTNYRKQRDLNNIAFVKLCLMVGPDLPSGWKQLYPDMEWIDMNNTFVQLLPKYNLKNNLAYNEDEYHVQDTTIMNMPNDPSGHNLDDIKNSIIEHGSVVAPYYETQDKEYNKENNCYYDSVHEGINHIVTIVGWDDNFAKEKFTETPPGNGAWLVRNSWGGNPDSENQYCHSGYFWISYYNRFFTSVNPPIMSFDAEPSNNYDNNYHYDNSSYFFNFIFSDKLNTVANVYTAKANNDGYEQLDAVSIGVDRTPMECELQIYKNLSDKSNPTSGTPCFDVPQQVYLENSGLHTIKLNKTLYLNQGDNYSVVFTHKKSFPENLIFATTTNTDLYDLKCFQETKEGQCFVNVDNNWIDLNSENAVLDIKAYTKNVYKLNYEGEVVSEQFVRNNTEVELPVSPDPLFAYVYSIDGKEITGPTFKVTKNSTIKIEKKRIAYNIFYELNGGVNSSLNPSISYLDEQRDQIPIYNPTKENNAFLGWIDVTHDKNSTQKIKSIKSKQENDIYLVAIFSDCSGQTETMIPMTNTDNSGFVIKATGKLKLDIEKNTELDFSYLQIDKQSEEYKDIIKKADIKDEVLNASNIQFKVNDNIYHENFGNITLNFYLNNEENSKYKIYHIHSNDVITTETGTIKNNIVSTTVSDLSPFIIENINESPSPVPAPVDNNTYNDTTAQTSDFLSIYLWICIFSIVAVLTFVCIYKRRKN